MLAHVHARTHTKTCARARAHTHTHSCVHAYRNKSSTARNHTNTRTRKQGIDKKEKDGGGLRKRMSIFGIAQNGGRTDSPVGKGANAFEISTSESSATGARKFILGCVDSDEAAAWVTAISAARKAALDELDRKNSWLKKLRRDLGRRYDSMAVQGFFAAIIALNFLLNIAEKQVQCALGFCACAPRICVCLCVLVRACVHVTQSTHAQIVPLPDDDHKNETAVTVFWWFDIVFTSIFTFELCWNMFANLFLRFVCDPWNIFDLFVVTCSIVALLPFMNWPSLSVLRQLRVFRAVRLFRKIHSLRVLVMALMKSIMPVFSALVIFSVCFCVRVRACECIYDQRYWIRSILA